MVFLDQVGVKQTDPVVAAATAEHSIFLRDTQLGNGLSGIEDAAIGVLDALGISACQRSSAGKCLQKIDGAAFGRQQAASRAADFAHDTVG